MTEIKGEYHYQTNVYGLIVQCQCGEPLGMIKLIDGLEVLYIGSVMVRSISANCSKCGHEFYYDLNGKKLERLIKKMTE